jgi:hypothetical protein
MIPSRKVCFAKNRHVRRDDQTLILKHASASRQSGKWNDNDFDVLREGVVVGRIFKANAAPCRGSGHCPLGITKIARRRTAMRRRARPR